MPVPSHPPGPTNLSMDHCLKIIFWNVRGLNSGTKRSAVRSVIASADPCIMCLLETKMNSVSLSTVIETLGPPFTDFYFLPTAGTHGGILLAWRSDRVALPTPLLGRSMSPLPSPLELAQPHGGSRAYTDRKA